MGYPVSCPPLSAVYYSTYRFNSPCCILLLAIYSPFFCSFLVSLWSCHFSSNFWSASPGTPGFSPRPVRLGFMVIKVALGNVFLFSPVSNIPPVLPAHSFIYSDAMQLTIYSVIKHNTYPLFYVAVCDFFLCYSLFFLGTLLVMYTPVCARMPSVCSDFDTPVSELCEVLYHMSVTRLPNKKDVMEEVDQDCRLCPEAVRRTVTTMLDVS